MSYEDDQDEILASAREVRMLEGQLEQLRAENEQLRSENERLQATLMRIAKEALG